MSPKKINNVDNWLFVAVDGASFPGGGEDRACAQRRRQGQGRLELRLPGRGGSRGRGARLLHRGALHRLQVRHSRAEDRAAVQGLHAQVHLGQLEDLPGLRHARTGELSYRKLPGDLAFVQTALIFVWGGWGNANAH